MKLTSRPVGDTQKILNPAVRTLFRRELDFSRLRNPVELFELPVRRLVGDIINALPSMTTNLDDSNALGR